MDTVITEINGYDGELSFIVDEGQKYSIGKVEINLQGTTMTEEDLKDIVHVKEGDIFNALAINNVITNIKIYGSKIDDSVDVDTEYRQNENTMDLIFNVKQNPKVYINEINVLNNTRTQENVIRRELRIAEGDLLKDNNILASERRLHNLNFFEKVNLEKIYLTNDITNINVVVDEKKPVMFASPRGILPTLDSPEISR